MMIQAIKMALEDFLIPQIGFAFTAIFISFLWFRKKLGKVTENEPDIEPVIEKKLEKLGKDVRFDYKEKREERNKEKIVHRVEEKFEQKIEEKIVKKIEEKLDESDGQLDSVTIVTKEICDENKNIGEKIFSEIQESNISEILKIAEQKNKDEKKDSAFETSESEAETKEIQFTNERVSVTELNISQTEYEIRSLDAESTVVATEERADSGTTSPSLEKNEISPIKPVETTPPDFSPKHQRRNTIKIEDQLRKNIENIFTDEEYISDESEEDEPETKRPKGAFIADKISTHSEESDNMKGAIYAEKPIIDHKPPLVTPMVIDVGSMWTRIGKANSETPEIIERTMIGDLRRTLTNKEQTYYGNDVANKSGILTRREPVKKDQVDWNDFFDMAEHFMEKKLEVDLSDQPITMSAKYDRKSSMSAVQALFEGRHVPSVYLTSQAACGLYGAGYTSGIVAHGGNHSVEIIPIYEGSILHHARTITHGGGAQMLEKLRVFMRDECATPLNSFPEYEFLRHVIEGNAAFSTSEYPTNQTASKTEFELPDGRIINFRDGIPKSTEFILPKLEIFEKILSNCDRDLLSGGVFSTCVMSGGLSKIRNYSSAINSQLQTALRTVKSNRKLWQNGDEVLHGKINPVNSSDAELLSWKGASAISANSNFSQSSISKEMYAEFGESIVERFY